MSNFIFTSTPDGNNLGYTQNGGNLVDGQTNIGIVSKEILKIRFYADIIKDALEQPSVSNIITILKNIWNGDVPSAFTTPSSYKGLLNSCETLLFSSQGIKDKETDLKNIIKTSTVGSNTKISLAKNAIWESGFGVDKICINNNVNVWKTPASDLDTLPKGNPPGVKNFPDDIPLIDSITFDLGWHNRMGFPNETVWKWTRAEDVQITYDNTYSLNKSEIDVQSYANGNKNSTINQLSVQDQKFQLLSKEYGDVAQVWMYFAYVAIQHATSREDAVMITTDSVVYFMCALLNISCVYTGGRKGVTTGNCSLKHYLSGQINLTDKIQTILRIQYERVIAHNNAIKIGLNIMFIDLNKFEYFRQDGDRMKRTYGSFQVDIAKKVGIQQLIRKYTDAIDTYNNDLQNVYMSPAFQTIPITITNDIVNTIYNDFYNLSETKKMPQWITKLPNKNYVLNPSSLLYEFGAIVGVNVPNIPGQIENITINNLDVGQVQLGGKQSGQRDAVLAKVALNQTAPVTKLPSKLVVRGSKPPNQSGGGKIYDLGYYESVIMIYTYVSIFNTLPANTGDINTAFKTNPNTEILFACKYDLYARDLKTIQMPLMTSITDKYGDDDIITIGSILSDLIYFAEDSTIEEPELTKEFMELQAKTSIIPTRQLRSSSTPIYSQKMQYSHCDNTIDPITQTKIPTGMGIEINGRCYDIRSLLRWYQTSHITEYIDFYRIPITDPTVKQQIQTAMEMADAGTLKLRGGKLKKFSSFLSDKSTMKRMIQTPKISGHKTRKHKNKEGRKKTHNQTNKNRKK